MRRTGGEASRSHLRFGQVTAAQFAGLGDTVRVTVLVDSWPDLARALPPTLQAIALPDLAPLAAPDVAVLLHDDGVAPDSLAHDRVWSGQVRVEEGRHLPGSAAALVSEQRRPDSGRPGLRRLGSATPGWPHSPSRLGRATPSRIRPPSHDGHRGPARSGPGQHG